MPSSSIVTGPSLSPATTTSSSVIAEAIQSALRWETRPERAVTRPPPPRCTVRSPRSSRPNSAGPRFETIVSGCLSGTHRLYQPGVKTPADPRLVGVEVGEDAHPVEQQARGEEPLTGALLARAPEPPPQLRVLEDRRAPLRRLI